MKQRILALLLAAGLCLGLIAAAPALAFSDVSGEELSEAVEVLSGLGIVSGYSDRSYHPDDALTRAQFCKLAVLTEGHGDQARGSAYRTRFSDVPGGGWAAPYINLAGLRLWRRPLWPGRPGDGGTGGNRGSPFAGLYGGGDRPLLAGGLSE